MINLLPPQDRKELVAARTNSLLLRYVILLSIFIGFVIIEVGVVYVMLDTDKRNNESTIADNQAKTANYAPVKQQAENFRNNLAVAKYILGKQVPYTTFILAVANSLPEGAVLDQLALDPATFGQESTLNVKTTSYNKAIDIKTALQNAKVNGKPLFSSVSFESVSSSDATDTSYPFSAVYSVTYAKDLLQ